MNPCPPTSPIHRCSVTLTAEQLQRRVASDEALLQTIAILSDSARLTVSNASRAVHDAQNALLAAHAWLANALATAESYRLEHLRLAEMVARSRSLLSVTAASLPDELVVQIAQLCVDDAREGLEYAGNRGSEMGGRKGMYGTAWIYPMALSQVCRRWRTAVLGSPRLWSYLNNVSPAVAPPLAELFQLRNGACTLDAVWTVSSSLPPTSQPNIANQSRWRTLRLLHSNTHGNNAPAIPFAPLNQFSTLTSLVLTSFAHSRPPNFSSSHLKAMPKLTKISLHDVQFLAPPPYRHPLHIDLTIRYTSVISFREKDMNDIAIVFPNLRAFSLHIRGPYLNKHARQTSNGNTSDTPNGANQMPFSFPDLESLDISAKDLDHSLARFQGSFVPRLEKLTLRDNGLPAASTFFSHLVRSRVPLLTLGLSDYSDVATRIFRSHRGIKALEVPLNITSLDILRPSTTNPPPIGSPPATPVTINGKGAGAPILAFPSAVTLILAPPTEDAEGSLGKIEGAALNGLAKIVRERNVVVFGVYGVKLAADSVAEKPGNGGVDVEEIDKTKPMTSEDTLVDISTAFPPPPTSKGPLPPLPNEKGRTPATLGVVPILDVQYPTVGGVISGPISRRGRVAMEEVYKTIIDGRKSWKFLGFDATVATA